LGNTCFMNCILQVLVHAPPVARYFLTDQHNRFKCRSVACKHERERADDSSTSPGLPAGRSSPFGAEVATSTAAVHKPCLSCEMDLLVSQCFAAASSSSYSPQSFLHAMWASCDSLAGYSQQDAHEFMISLLSSMSAARPMTTSGSPQRELRISPPPETRMPPANLQQFFRGVMQSQVTCSVCGSHSTKLEEFHDLSLDLNPAAETLEKCLKSFTQPEGLGERCWCASCGTHQQSTKQLSLRRLPNVLTLHLKRFKQQGGGKASYKIDKYVEFPLHSLDVSSYTSAHFNAVERITSPLPSALHHIYDLFGVAIHHGSMNQGHYTAYVRHRSCWFHCDDAIISRSTESEVLSTQAYMLFYIQKQLSYLNA